MDKDEEEFQLLVGTKLPPKLGDLKDHPELLPDVAKAVWLAVQNQVRRMYGDDWADKVLKGEHHLADITDSIQEVAQDPAFKQDHFRMLVDLREAWVDSFARP